MFSPTAWPDLLRSLRKRRRLSRPELAAAAQISAAAIKAYESGLRRPRLLTARRLLRSLGADQREIRTAAAALGYHPLALLRGPAHVPD